MVCKVDNKKTFDDSLKKKKFLSLCVLGVRLNK